MESVDAGPPSSECGQVPQADPLGHRPGTICSPFRAALISTECRSNSVVSKFHSYREVVSDGLEDAGRCRQTSLVLPRIVSVESPRRSDGPGPTPARLGFSAHYLRQGAHEEEQAGTDAEVGCHGHCYPAASLAVPRSRVIGADGGGGRIRTHGALQHSGFQDRRLRPLGHPSALRRKDRASGYLRVNPIYWRTFISEPVPGPGAGMWRWVSHPATTVPLRFRSQSRRHSPIPRWRFKPWSTRPQDTRSPIGGHRH